MMSCWRAFHQSAIFSGGRFQKNALGPRPRMYFAATGLRGRYLSVVNYATLAALFVLEKALKNLKVTF